MPDVVFEMTKSADKEITPGERSTPRDAEVRQPGRTERLAAPRVIVGVSAELVQDDGAARPEPGMDLQQRIDRRGGGGGEELAVVDPCT